MDTIRDVIVIGGGLSGLAAAYELEQHNIRYTLIEVKDRLGGSIRTEARDGFVMDGGVFAFPMPDTWPTLDELGLADALYTLTEKPNATYATFRNGTQHLIDALAERLTGTIIYRMAVTSIGHNEQQDGFMVCLENGLALEARAVIVAVPARFAERMFYTLAPEVSAALMPYYYDQVVRVALGYHAHNKPDKQPQSSPNMLFASLNTTDHPDRVPKGGLLLQAAIRAMPDAVTPDAFVQLLTDSMGWGQPSVYSVNYWAESDPLTVTGPPKALHRANELLPDGVRLVGNCYRALTLAEHTELARDAARQIVATLPRPS